MCGLVSFFPYLQTNSFVQWYALSGNFVLNQSLTPNCIVAYILDQNLISEWLISFFFL